MSYSQPSYHPAGTIGSTQAHGLQVSQIATPYVNHYIVPPLPLTVKLRKQLGELSYEWELTFHPNAGESQEQAVLRGIALLQAASVTRSQ